MHGNKLDNLKPHHLYVIFRLSNFEVFKYGISDDPIDDFDGLSARVRDQVEEWNMAAEYQKFDAKILATDIAGRVEALTLERAYIDAFFEKFGRNPSANKFPRRKS